MSKWYNKVTSDLSYIPDALEYYNNELIQAKQEVKISGRLEMNSASLSGIVEHRFGQLQEIEAILEYLNIQLRKIKKKHFKKYLESYNRALSSRDAEKYADGEDEVIDFSLLVNEVALCRNKWLGVIKALEVKQFQVGHIVKLRTAGLDDAII